MRRDNTEFADWVRSSIYADNCARFNSSLTLSCVAGLIFVVDSNDRERVQEAKDELTKMLSEDELRDCILLVRRIDTRPTIRLFDTLFRGRGLCGRRRSAPWVSSLDSARNPSNACWRDALNSCMTSCIHPHHRWLWQVFANKQDLPNAMSCSELTDKLGLNQLGGSKKWYIQATCAPQGEGLYEGLDWLSSQMADK